MSKRSRKTTPYTVRRPYDGKLKQRIVLDGQRDIGESGLQPSAEGLEYAQKVQAAILLDLLKMFGIPESALDRWERLSVHLAENCVPAMQIVLREPRKIGGQERFWDPHKFVARVDELVASGKSQNGALKQAGLELKSKAKLDSLRNQYSKGRIRLALLSVKVDEFLANNPRLAKLLGL